MRDFISSFSPYIGARFGPGNAEQIWRTPACTSSWRCFVTQSM
jgi:hypothetical protein